MRSIVKRSKITSRLDSDELYMENLALDKDEADFTDADEAALVKAARSDPAAFSALYRRYVTPVYRYLYKWVGNAGEAEDLTSLVFTAMVEGLGHYHEQGNFAAWLFTIARRKAIAAYRRQHPDVSLDRAEELSGPGEDPLEQVVQGERQTRMAALFAGLNEEQRELLRLRFSAGLGYAEIGAVLGRGEAAVKMAIYRLVHQMHEQWEEK
jgi:RNA polymerase sigma-70 factor, ECF subfamily